MAITYTVDRFAIANSASSGTLTAKQVTLSAADQAAIGGFTNKAVILSPTPVEGLSAYYPFDSNVLDASGNGNILTVTGSVSYVPGRVGSNAVYLANEANVIATPTKASNQLTRSITLSSSTTLSFWLNFTKAPLSGQYCTPVAVGTFGASPEIITTVAQYVNTTQTALFVYLGSGNSSTVTLNINTWYHISIIYNPSTTSYLYVNGGSTIISVAAGTNYGNYTLIIGEIPTTSYNRPFAGFIDDFRIYNRALSASEIAVLANVAPIQVAPATTLASGLTIRLTFDNTTADAQGTLGAPTTATSIIYSSLSKSGTYSLDMTGNTAGNTTTTCILQYSYTANTLPLTVSFWINPSVINTLQMPISSALTGTVGFNFVIQSNGTYYATIYIANTGYQATSPTAFLANTWYFITFTAIHSGYIILYTNGVSTAVKGDISIPSSGTLGTVASLRLGSSASANNNFKGYIDDVRIYNRALSPQEVAGLYYSYSAQPYVLYQQTIEGQNIADLGWGTTAAQPATVSAWIKNNTANSQQFSLSVANSGASAITAITFESGIDDTLGFLTNATGTNVAYSTSVYKVGSRALDLTANTAAGTATTNVLYYLPNFIQPPITISIWLRATALSGTQSFVYDSSMNIPGSSLPGACSLSLTTTYILFDGWVGPNPTTNNGGYGANWVGVNSSTTLQIDTWYNIVIIVAYNEKTKLYLNGQLLVSSTNTCLSSGYFVSSAYGVTGYPANALRLGGYGNNILAFDGYIDDLRIYNRALSATEVYAIYAANSVGTTISPYLLPRSFVYTTPAITAGSWYKAQVTIPAETAASTWGGGSDAGLVLALCLGAGSNYVAPTNQTWASAEYMTGSNVQVWGESATNFLAAAGNNIFITGVQLEKGLLSSAFEIRPYTTELQLCMRYYEKTYDMKTIVGTNTTYGIYMGQGWVGTNIEGGVSISFNIIKRVSPSLRYWDSAGTENKTSEFGNSTLSNTRPGFAGIIITEKGFWVNLDGTNNGTTAFHWEVNCDF
jgi:hypothetical protein